MYVCVYFISDTKTLTKYCVILTDAFSFRTAGMDFVSITPPLQLEFNATMMNGVLICADIYIIDDAVVENRECFYVVLGVSSDDSAIEVDPGMARVCTVDDDSMFAVTLMEPYICCTGYEVNIFTLACSCGYSARR